MIGFPKPVSRAAEIKARAKAAVQAYRSVRQAVKARDQYRCRVCRSEDRIGVHHIQFRSRGGKGTLRNLAVLCAVCHAEIHAYRLSLSGDANGRLRIERLSR